jgi:segregation and condensation protein A
MSEESVEILAQMAERGEIDPWNIDIVEVTDQFLAELKRRHELDLRVSGRTLFYSSVLLRMKSEYLDAPQKDEDEGEFPDEDPPTEDAITTTHAFGPIEMLEREIDRRIKRKDVRKRPVTLYELITQLKLAEKAERRRQRRQKLACVDDDTSSKPDATDVVGIAHDEEYDAMAQRICAIVYGPPEVQYPGISLYDLVSALHLPLYQVYISCLYLMLDGLVDLEQDEFFGDLWVMTSDGSSMKNEETT